MTQSKSLREDIAAVLNSHSVENASDTPDFILAAYLIECLKAFEVATEKRERWYGRGSIPCSKPKQEQ